MKKVTKAVAALMLMTAVVCAAGCNKLDEPNNGGDNEVNLNGSGTYNGHDYVDLGLPSGTMWATSNVEAGNAKGYAYFAWGETETKSTYDWTTYKHRAGGDYPPTALTKYCYDQRFGFEFFTDNLTVLEPEDDPATVHWGEGWRTPTIEEWKELKDNCTCEWTTRNGINGGLFTAPNGNTLFLPAAGNYDTPQAGGLLHYNETGRYWSSSLSTYVPHSADEIQIHHGGLGYGDFLRFLGCTIRAVH